MSGYDNVIEANDEQLHHYTFPHIADMYTVPQDYNTRNTRSWQLGNDLYQHLRKQGVDLARGADVPRKHEVQAVREFMLGGRPIPSHWDAVMRTLPLARACLEERSNEIPVANSRAKLVSDPGGRLDTHGLFAGQPEIWRRKKRPRVRIRPSIRLGVQLAATSEVAGAHWVNLAVAACCLAQALLDKGFKVEVVGLVAGYPLANAGRGHKFVLEAPIKKWEQAAHLPQMLTLMCTPATLRLFGFAQTLEHFRYWYNGDPGYARNLRLNADRCRSIDIDYVMGKEASGDADVIIAGALDELIQVWSGNRA